MVGDPLHVRVRAWNMDLSQAIECANAFVFPGFLTDDASLSAERSRNEEALGVLRSAWMDAPVGKEPFPYELVLDLADRNRDICDRFGTERLRSLSPSSLARGLPAADLIRAVAVLQRRSVAQVTALSGPDARDLNVAWVDAPVSGMVVGIDIETTERDPARGYIINVGLEFMTVGPKAKPHDPFVGYFGLPEMYATKGVPLTEIHQITWSDLAGRVPFREDKQVQKALLATLCAYPFMAHNAAFEDSWFMLHIDGYAGARKDGRIVPIDTRDVCRRVDPEVRILPHETRPASLQSWAQRRGTLKAGESERHLGLDDVELMLATVQAEFAERNML